MHVRTSGIIYRTSSSLIPRIVIARPPVIVSLLTSPVALKPLPLYILRMNKILYASTIGGYATLPLSIYPMDASVWVAFYLASSIICPSVRLSMYHGLYGCYTVFFCSWDDKKLTTDVAWKDILCIRRFAKHATLGIRLFSKVFFLIRYRYLNKKYQILIYISMDMVQT